MSPARRPPVPTADAALEYLPLVQRVARRLGRRLPPQVGLDDLIGAGIVGLLEAMQRFDAAQGQDFAAYAEFRIKGAMLDELRRSDMMARDARSESNRLERTMSLLAQRLSRPPSEEELAAELQLPVEELYKLLERLTPVRLCSFEERNSAGGRSPFDITAQQEGRQRLAAALAQLTTRQQQVLHLYYQQDLTMKEIGLVLEVSESRVCQIMSAITLTLRALLRDPEKPNG